MKPWAFCDSALLCRGPIQNSLSHFNPPPPTTQRLRDSATRRSIYAWRRFHTNCCFSTSCRKELRSRNGIDLASLRLPTEGLAHFAPRFSQNPGLLHKFDPARQREEAKDVLHIMTASTVTDSHQSSYPSGESRSPSTDSFASSAVAATRTLVCACGSQNEIAGEESHSALRWM